MCSRLTLLIAAFTPALSPITPTADAQSLTTELVATGLARPVFVASPPGDLERLFIVEQRSGSIGRVRAFDLTTNQLHPTPFLSVSVSTGGEQGLLGLAFHPDFATNGHLYINYTDQQDRTRIVRYTASSADPNLADPNSATPILTIDQPFRNHNGGWMTFAADGTLYIASGDGGSSNDPQNNSQNTTTLLGSILRIDVDTDDFPTDPDHNYGIPPSNPFVGVVGADEILIWGLRNPWRNSLDPVTGRLYIADVGQDRQEEITILDPVTDAGANLGWLRCEGFVDPFTGAPCTPPPGAMLPDYVYSHTSGRCSITGGEVYRGCAIPELRGTYFFADFCTGEIFSFNATNGSVAPITDRTAELGVGPFDTVSFGRDALGELYICDLDGQVLRIIAADGSNACNDCPPDLDEDGDFTVFDILEAIRVFDANEPNAQDPLAFLDAALPKSPGCGS